MRRYFEVVDNFLFFDGIEEETRDRAGFHTQPQQNCAFDGSAWKYMFVFVPKNNPNTNGDDEIPRSCGQLSFLRGNRKRDARLRGFHIRSQQNHAFDRSAWSFHGCVKSRAQAHEWSTANDQIWRVAFNCCRKRQRREARGSVIKTMGISSTVANASLASQPFAILSSKRKFAQHAKVDRQERLTKKDLMRKPPTSLSNHIFENISNSRKRNTRLQRKFTRLKRKNAVSEQAPEAKPCNPTRRVWCRIQFKCDEMVSVVPEFVTEAEARAT